MDSLITKSVAGETMREDTYAALSARLHRRGSLERLPLNGTLELTHRCPLACTQCYNNLPVGDGQARREELSFEEVRRILDEMADAGCLWLLLSGGEIFARKDFLAIYRHARGRGFIITLFTNGILIDDAMADALAEEPPFLIEITLYGYSRETYEALTEIPGSHARCLRAIERLVARKIPLKLKTVVVTVNAHELEAMAGYARSLGLPFKFDAFINPRTDGSLRPLQVRLPPAEIVALDLKDAGRVAGWRDLLVRQQAIPVQAEHVYSCGGAVTSFAVDPYGGLSLCVLSAKETFDLRQGSFADGWQRFLGQVRNKKRTRPSKCASCGLKSLCGMCPANGELHSGDAETPVDYLCATAHLRALAIDAPIPPHGPCDYCAGGDRHQALLAELAVTRELAATTAVTPHPGRHRLTVLKDSGDAGCGGTCGGGL